MLAFGKVAATILLLVALLLLLGSVFVACLLDTRGEDVFGTSGLAPAGAVYGGENAVTRAAKAMAAHLNSACLTLNPNPDCLGDASFDSGFPQTILDWGQRQCPGCLAWMNNHFQCVSFVLGAYGLFHPLDLSGNGADFAGLYASTTATTLGYQERLPARGELPVTPGDIMAWGGGHYGHVSIVLGWVAPRAGHAGTLTFAQANGEKPIQTLPILPDGRIETADGYWNGFVVEAYIHPAWLPIVSPASSTASASVPKSPFVTVARTDALVAGIDPDLSTRQSVMARNGHV